MTKRRNCLLSLDRDHRLPSSKLNRLSAGETITHGHLGQLWSYTPSELRSCPLGPYRAVTSTPAGQV